MGREHVFAVLKTCRSRRLERKCPHRFIRGRPFANRPPGFKTPGARAFQSSPSAAQAKRFRQTEKTVRPVESGSVFAEGVDDEH